MAKRYIADTRRNASATPLKEAIEEMFRAYKLDFKFNETHLLTYWTEIMGKTIATRTTKLTIRNKVLYVQLTSAALKNDLNLSKTKVIALLNKAAGSEVLTDVVFQ